MNRPLLLKIAVFLLGTICLLALVEWGMERTMESVKYGTVGKINAVMDHSLDTEITIWGASTAYGNLNPQLMLDSLGLETMNMGIRGTNIDQFNGYLQEYISYTEKSQFLLIALDVHGALYKRNSFHHLYHWVHHLDQERVYDCFTDIDPTFMWKTRYVPFYKLSLYDKHGFPHFRSALLNPRDTYHFPKLGFEARKGGDVVKLNAENQLAPFEAKIGTSVFEKLRSSCSKAIAKNLRPIVIVTPAYIEGLQLITNRQEVIQKLQSLQQEGVLVWDFSETDLSFEPTYFADNTHLNAEGADLFTQQIIQQLKTLR